MFGVILGIAGGLIAALAAIGIVFIVGMRRKSGLVQGAVIWVSKQFNKVALRTAGQAGGAARVHHRGRTSGRVYETPVDAVATDDGFLIALPYGLRSNWVRNVLASGTASLGFEGRTYAVDRPELVPLRSVETAFSLGNQRMHRLFGVTEVLRLRHAATGEVGLAA